MNIQINRCAKVLSIALSIVLLVNTVVMTASLSHAATVRDHRVNGQQAESDVAVFKTWVIGANRSGVVDAVISPTSPQSSRYSLKGLDNKKFFQYERQGKFGGINLGWTDNANAQTAKDTSYWILVPKNQSRRVGEKNRGEAIRSTPIKYGEVIALGKQARQRTSDVWRLRNTWEFLKYGQRNVGINLNWEKLPAYEWAVLGGTPGTTVKLGKDKVILYNLKHKQPMIYVVRNGGAHIGWPDSKIVATKYADKKNLSPQVWNALLMKNQ